MEIIENKFEMGMLELIIFFNFLWNILFYGSNFHFRDL